MGLDMSKANRVYGSSLAYYNLNGRYFDHLGKEVMLEDAGKPNPEDPLVKTAPAKVETVPTYNPPKSETVAQAPSTHTRLRKMPARKVAELVNLAGGTPETGLGSKKNNMAWLLENVK